MSAAPLPTITCPTGLPTSLTCAEAQSFTAPAAPYSNNAGTGCVLSGTVSFAPGDATKQIREVAVSVYAFAAGPLRDPSGRQRGIVVVKAASREALTKPHSRYPVIRGSSDDLIGFVESVSVAQTLAAKRRERAERDDVDGHVGGATRAIVAVGDPHHRHRRLRRHPRGGAVPVAIEHDVAHDQHPAALEHGEIGLQRETPRQRSNAGCAEYRL